MTLRPTLSFFRILGLSALLAAAPALGHAAQDAPLPTLKVTVFSPPSQSIWIPTLIQKLGLDRKHGFALQVTPKPSKIAYAEFASGIDPVCYCAAIAAVSRFKQQGADITLLWNIFNYDAFVVTNNPAVKTIGDLEGRVLQADTITGSWALGKWFLDARKVDMSKVQVKSAGARGAASLAELHLKRIDAVLLNPTEASAAITLSPEPLRAISVFDAQTWKTESGADALPAIAFGVWRNWYEQPANRDLARRFYAANVEAQDYIRKNPERASQLVAESSKIEQKALLDVFTRYGGLINLKPIGEYRSTIATLTQKLLVESKELPRAMTAAELDRFVSDFKP